VAEGRATIMTLQEVARFLRVHPMTIYRLIQRGDLPAARVGRSWRFRKDQINSWLLAREVNSNHLGAKHVGARSREKAGRS
jgi:excisionase family DNA binding protein